MPMHQQEQIRPLAMPSPDPAALDATRDFESQNKLSSARYLRRRHAILCCCGCVGVTVILFGLLVLILALVFRIKDPTLVMNAMRVTDLRRLPNTSSFNLSLIADLSINNPNDAPYDFGNSTTEFFYKNKTVALGYTGAGRVGRDREVRMNITVAVVANTNVSETDNGRIELSSYSEIEGSVKVLGIYKRHKTIVLNCFMWPDLNLPVQDLNKSCEAKTRSG